MNCRQWNVELVIKLDLIRIYFFFFQTIWIDSEFWIRSLLINQYLQWDNIKRYKIVIKYVQGLIRISFFFFQTIGIDSEFCIVESLVTGIVDMWPEYLRPRRRQFTTGICFLLFLCGVPMVTNGGAYIFQVRYFH